MDLSTLGIDRAPDQDQISPSTPNVTAILQHNNFTVGGNLTFNFGTTGSQHQGESSKLSFEDARKLADWLSPLNYHQYQKDIFEKVVDGTGSWILEHQEFISWMNGDTKILWGVGIPGTGKTCLVSFIVNHLVSNKQATVIYVYCQYKDSLALVDILACLLKQLVEQSDEVASYVYSTLYSKCLRTATQPSGSELARALSEAISKTSNVFLVVDALDELSERTSSDLILKLISLKLPVLLTSRPHTKLPTLQKPNLLINAPDKDIYTFASLKLTSMVCLESFLQKPGLKDEITREICSKCNGMFLLAALQIDTLASGDIINVPTLWQAIRKLPTSLNNQYQLIVERIQTQNQIQRDLACQAIQLVMHSTRTLHVRELLEALTVDVSAACINQDHCTTEETLLRVSCGLLTVFHGKDKELAEESEVEADRKAGDPTIQLIHYSVQTYLEEQHFLPARSHTFIANILAAYLICNSGRCQLATITSIPDLEKGEILSAHPFLSYACLNIGYHTFKAANYSGGVLPDQVALLFQRQLTMPLPLTLLGNHLDHGQAVHLGALYGLEYLLQDEYSSSGITLKSALGCSPLFYACLGGQTALVKEITGLLSARIEIGQSTAFGATVLHAAFRSGDLSTVQLLLPMTSFTERKQHLLLGHSKIDINAKMSNGKTPLHLASEYGYSTIIKGLLESMNRLSNANSTGRSRVYSPLLIGYKAALNWSQTSRSSLLDAQDKDNWTPLHYAAQNGHEAVVQLLLESLDVNVNAQEEGGWAPLHFAALNGHQKIVQLLLASADINVNVEEPKKWTPLHLTALAGNQAVLQLLLASPTLNINAQNSDRWTPLHLAARYGHKEAVQALVASPSIDVNSELANKRKALHMAATYGHLPVIQVLLTCSEVEINDKEKDMWTPLHVAARYGHKAVVQYLLGCSGIEVNVAKSDGMTPLHLAASVGYEEVVQLLLASPQIDVNAETTDKWTPLHLAARHGQDTSVKLLLALPSINANAKTRSWHLFSDFEQHYPEVVHVHTGPTTESDGWTPLHFAAAYGHHTVIQLLLASPGIQVNTENKDKRTPLHLAVIHNYPRVVQLLLASPGIDINATDKDQRSPLIMAAAYGHQDIVQLLLASSCIAVNAVEEEGSTALHYACKNAKCAVIELLLAFPGININAETMLKCTPLFIAVWEGHQPVIQLLLASPSIDVNAGAKNGKTPLQIAAEFNKQAIVQLLLTSPGIEVNAASADRQTALHLAAREGYQAVVQLLLAAPGIDVNVPANYEATPLHLAAFNGRLATVRLLLSSSAINVHAKDVSGDTPADCATRNGHKDVVELLHSHSSNEAQGSDIVQAEHDGPDGGAEVDVAA